MNRLHCQPGQVTYPKMERQDLTQAQLGAFKFVPTDANEGHPVFSQVFTPQRPIQQALTQAFSPSLHSDFVPTRHLPHRTGPVSNAFDAALRYPQQPVQPVRFDPSFPDRRFRPDYEESQSHLLPRLLQAAANSYPMNSNHHYKDSKPIYEGHYPTTMPSDNREIEISRRHNDYNVESAVRSVSADTPTADPAEAMLFYRSLLRALGSEQEAHQVTRDALEAEKAAKQDVEQYIDRILGENQTLIATVQMLKSVVQHNISKEEKIEEHAAHRTSHQAVKDPYRVDTLLHDAVRNLGHPSKAATRDVEEIKKIEPITDNHIFNFDIPQTSEFDHLRRHFSDKAIPATKVRGEQSDNKNQDLIPITPEKINQRDKHHKPTEVHKNRSDTSTDKQTDEEYVIVESKPQEGPSLMAMPFDVHVQWSGQPIFDNEQDKIRHLGSYRSTFFLHPVRYHAKQSDRNLYRTVIIDFLPMGTTYKRVLSTIHGGSVESIQLLGPVGQSTNFMTARIVFNYELGAQGVYMRGQSPGIFVSGKRVRVWQVLEPTYPRNEDLESEIFNDGYTRLLLINNVTQEALDMISTKLAHQSNTIIEVRESHDGIPLVEFTGVAACSRALKQLMSDPDFSGCMFDFEEDPCNDPY